MEELSVEVRKGLGLLYKQLTELYTGVLRLERVLKDLYKV
jgi:hypothetical protein